MHLWIGMRLELASEAAFRAGARSAESRTFLAGTLGRNAHANSPIES